MVGWKRVLIWAVIIVLLLLFVNWFISRMLSGDSQSDGEQLEEDKVEIGVVQERGDLNPECSSDVYNCGDFSTHAEAQAVFDSCDTDIHMLDRDSDGVACEGLG